MDFRQILIDPRNGIFSFKNTAWGWVAKLYFGFFVLITGLGVIDFRFLKWKSFHCRRVCCKCVSVWNGSMYGRKLR